MLVKRIGTIFFAIELSLWEISSLCTCTRSFARANDAKIVRNRDAQCNTEESPLSQIGNSFSPELFHQTELSKQTMDLNIP